MCSKCVHSLRNNDGNPLHTYMYNMGRTCLLRIADCVYSVLTHTHTHILGTFVKTHTVQNATAPCHSISFARDFALPLTLTLIWIFFLHFVRVGNTGKPSHHVDHILFHSLYSVMFLLVDFFFTRPPLCTNGLCVCRYTSVFHFFLLSH